MAVEDGAVLGRLLGLFSRAACSKTSLPELMHLYQSVRKERATAVVKLADDNRALYHMADGPNQEQRDQILGQHDWWDDNLSFPWAFADSKHLCELYGFDALKSADDGFASSGLNNRK